MVTLGLTCCRLTVSYGLFAPELALVFFLSFLDGFLKGYECVLQKE